MSYSICLKCKNMVGWYGKYCSECQDKFGLPDLPEWQKTNFTPNWFPSEKSKTHAEHWQEWADNEVIKDLATTPAKQTEEGQDD